MPKRYIVTWDPEAAPDPASDTSTASFELKREDDPKDDCPTNPRDEVVSNARRADLEGKDQKTFTCAELQRILGVALKPKPHN